MSNSNGVNFIRQTLPKDYENLIVAVGVNANVGKEISVAVEAFNLTPDIKVFLENRETGAFLNLGDNNTNYTVMLSKKPEGLADSICTLLEVL